MLYRPYEELIHIEFRVTVDDLEINLLEFCDNKVLLF